MTKEEVLQGALALNGSDKKYTVTVEGDKITIQSKFSANAISTRKGTFCCVAHLNNDNTYVETHTANDGRRSQLGKVVRVQKSISVTFGGGSDTIEVEKESFNSEDIKKILRDYLEGCGYKRKTNKRLVLAVSITLSAVVLFFILIAVIISSSPEFVDTNGPDNFALTEITRNEILSQNNNYRISMMSKRHSGHHTNIIGTKLRDYDYDHISKSFGKVHGVVILQATKISGNTLTLNINSSVESGNAEIIILVDGEYYCSVDVNKEESITLQGISNKEVIVKLAAEGAKMEVNISRIF